MELRQLEYFQMASRLKNITRAAERLRVSQPNITVAIKKLEAELGIQLFDRSQKQLALTPEGAVFLNRIELALRNIQDAVLEVNDYKQLQKGTIKIGIPSMDQAHTSEEIAEALLTYYRRYGYGDIASYRAFRWDKKKHLIGIRHFESMKRMASSSTYPLIPASASVNSTSCPAPMNRWIS